MNNGFEKKFKKSLNTGFVDKSVDSEVLYRPKLLVNKKRPKEKVLSSILQELRYCKEFYISVAFVTTSGIAVLLNAFIELEKKGIKGKILVSQYLNFTQPEALKKLLLFKNIELKISTKDNSHSKGYIFKTDKYYNLIIGSSNLTATALSTNKEWNLKVSGLHSSEIVENVLSEFDTDFKQAQEVTYTYITEYEKVYENQKLVRKEVPVLENGFNISPNTMQKEALLNLKNLRSEKKNKALLISATGTGKTFLSAFDVKAVNPKKVLFVVHRLNIAKKALETFKKVFKQEKTYGLYSGSQRDLDADYIFSTIQTISREDHLSQFSKDSFDYIIIDETHRSGADSYLRFINHFKPQFLLGMTATPERTDGHDIFNLFDHNVAYEIRLNQAMEEGMLSQFHYYGITHLEVNDEELEDSKDFNLLANDERVSKLIETAKFYGSDNGITRGLVFCNRNEEATNLSEKFNQNGFKTIALSGNNSETERAEAIRLLESNDINEKLDYIFTVDIFNEGIDIPKINQILMLRPTDSAIIFVQQLGRGLRKSGNKEFLTIVDFIGNHKNNYLIPVALYGDTSYNKDTLRKLISEGSKMIPGASTINFDEITKEKIFKSIASANMKVLTDLKKDYNLLKYRLGRFPMMMDFIKNQSRDPFLFVEYSKSYYNFIRKVDKDFGGGLDKNQILLLELFSREINNAKRVEESLILKELIKNKHLALDSFQEIVNNKYHYKPTRETITSCINNINFSFVRKQKNIVIKKNNILEFHVDFIETLNNTTFKNFLLDSINYSIQTFEKTYDKDNYKDGLILYNKYSRKDVCRLINWENDISSTVYGYRTRDKITPCFVTYHKSQDIEDTIKYNDHFLNPSIFAWESRSNRKVDSNEIKNVIASERILLFVKKEDAEGTDFYFMGDVSIIPNSIEQAEMPDSKKPIVHFKFQLEQPVIENIYNYITLENNITQESKTPKKTEVVDIEIKHTIPLYDFYAAAGSFSELQSEKSYSLIEVPEKYVSEDYFACRVIGNSMNRRIPDNSICIFKKYFGGSRDGKIVLVENRNIYDQDFNSAFTVKTYSSRKSNSEEGWQHQEILLKPHSFDTKYKDIVLDEKNSEGMNIVGEFIDVLK